MTSRNFREGRYAGKLGMPNSRGKYIRVHKRVGPTAKIYSLAECALWRRGQRDYDE